MKTFIVKTPFHRVSDARVYKRGDEIVVPDPGTPEFRAEFNSDKPYPSWCTELGPEPIAVQGKVARNDLSVQRDTMHEMAHAPRNKPASRGNA